MAFNNSNVKLLVFGHSYVRDIQSYLENEQIRCFSLPGGKVEDLFGSWAADKIHYYNPDAVLIIIGKFIFYKIDYHTCI